MRVEQKIWDRAGVKWLVSGLPDEAAPGDLYVVQTPEEAGTDRQNRLFHKLLHEIYKSRAWSFAGLSEKQHAQISWEHFKILIKIHFGNGVEVWHWADQDGVEHYTAKEPVPGTYVWASPKTGSWVNYKKPERTACIERVMAWAEEMGLGYLCEEMLKHGQA